MRIMICSVFFFQAEDGIRDLVRSRGLGDVYKRQNLGMAKITKKVLEYTVIFEPAEEGGYVARVPVLNLSLIHI